MLCKFCEESCNAVLELAQKEDASNGRWGRKTRIWGQTAQELLEGVAMKCDTCNMFWEHASEEYRYGVQNNSLYPPHDQEGFVNSCDITAMANMDAVSDPSVNRRLWLDLYYKPACTLDGRRPVPPGFSRKHGVFKTYMILPAKYVDPFVLDIEFTPNNGPEVSGVQIRQWLENCLNNHDKCKKPDRMRAKFPSRLLSVETETIKVQDTKLINEFESYVTLSHCWGTGARPITLTSKTMTSLKEGIPLSQLPKTFVDAIRITRSIGQKYIWIDSLCIIQDSTADWSSEAVHMGDIYRNSWCTIAATRAANSSVGCFVERKPWQLKLCKYRPPLELHSERHNNGTFYVLDRDLWVSAISRAPLNKRAWVVQERLLSPRTVHFSEGQVFWECGELGACESFPAGLPEQFKEQLPSESKLPVNGFKALLSDSDAERMRSEPEPGQNTGRNLFNSFLSPSHNNSPSPQPERAYEHWTRIVNEYSKCGLTVKTDKLVAICGVASKLKPALNDTFLAGLWQKHLAHGLAWSMTSDNRHRSFGTRAGPYRAPSWSWASIEGEVEYPNYERRQNWATHTVNCVVECREASGFGKVDGAVLTLRGPLQSVAMAKQQLSNASEWSARIQRMTNPSYNFSWDEKVFEVHNDKLFVTPVLCDEMLRKEKKHMVYGLLLERCEGERDRFQRVGLFSSHGHVNSKCLGVLFQGTVCSFDII